MIRVFRRLAVLGCLFLFAGCSSVNGTEEELSSGNPAHYLQNENADIFLLHGTVYSNASDVDWVLETEYSIGDEIGEITRQSENALFFKEGTANLLPVGTKIYDTDAPFYIVVLDDKEIPYLSMIEG